MRTLAELYHLVRMLISAVGCVEAAAGKPLVSGSLAGLVEPHVRDARVPAPARALEGLAEAMVEMVSTAGQVSASMALALSDGDVTAGEERTLSAKINKLMLITEAMQRRLHDAAAAAPARRAAGSGRMQVVER